MTRARWKCALFAALASAGVAWGQPSQSPSRGGENVVVIQEAGSRPERCRVLRTWTTASGHLACLLRTLDGGELVTVVQMSTPAPDASMVGARIYRWGHGDVTPAGAPVPPLEDGVRQTTYLPQSSELGGLELASTAEAPQAPGSAPSGCARGHCWQVHHYEQPPVMIFKSAGCVPVCSPAHSPSYGYYPTQWRQWPGLAEPMPVMSPEADDLGEKPEPRVSPASGLRRGDGETGRP